MGTDRLQNWAKNLTYESTQIHRPTQVEEIQELVRKAPKIRALGTRHSFNRLADTPDELISTERLQEIGEIDPQSQTVSIQPGVTYGKLSPELDRHGFALPNLASLPHISVVGACVTATHGSGVANRNLASSVSSFEVVLADGSLETFRRSEHSFQGALVSLGSLGIVSRLTLDLIPSFQVQQEVYEHLPFPREQSKFEEIVSGAYSVSLFWDWKSPTINQVWVKRKLESDIALPVPKEYFGATAATRNLHPLPELSAENCTEQMGIPGPWYERLPHFRMAFTPSSGEELQSEFFVDRSSAVEALLALSELANEISPLLFITEIRTVASDELWMSPNYRRESVGIHFTWKQLPEVIAVLPKIEAKLAPFQARPHWGKLFTIAGQEIEVLYEKVDEFQQLLLRYDPNRKFENPFVEEKIFANA